MEVSSAASSYMTAQSNKLWMKSNTDVTHLMEHVLCATIIQRTNFMDVLLSFLINMLHHDKFGVNLEIVLITHKLLIKIKLHPPKKFFPGYQNNCY